MKITVVDGFNSKTVSSTTVAYGSDITEYLNSLDKPVHEGFEFNGFSINKGSIKRVIDNSTVIIEYVASDGGTVPEKVDIRAVDSINGSVVFNGYVNKNSDITNLLSIIKIPTHDGYVFGKLDAGSSDITNITKNTIVYIRYIQSSEVPEQPQQPEQSETVPETVKIMVVDSLDKSVVFSGSVNKNSDITNILSIIAIPTHEGYVFEKWYAGSNDITNITKNTKVYIKYIQSSEVPEQPQQPEQSETVPETV